MTDDTADFGETWAYESIVGAVPGRSLSIGATAGFQLGLFGAAVVVGAWGYNLWAAVPEAAVAVLVTAGGSVAMRRIGRVARGLDGPPGFHRLLFGSSMNVVLGVVAFAALATYLVVDGGGFLTALFGRIPPPPAIFLALLVAWDLCYRIGTGWWTAVVTDRATRSGPIAE